jgi:hypothetical protein
MAEQARYICKVCGAESPTGIGYVLQEGEEPPRNEPDPNCDNLHLRPLYSINVTTWDNGRGHTEAMCDGGAKDHLLSLGTQALGLFPDLDVVVFRSKSHHSEITVYRKDRHD